LKEFFNIFEFDFEIIFFSSLMKVLRQDIRGVHQGRGKETEKNSSPYLCRLDAMDISFQCREGQIIIEKIEERQRKAKTVKKLLLSADGTATAPEAQKKNNGNLLEETLKVIEKEEEKGSKYLLKKSEQPKDQRPQDRMKLKKNQKESEKKTVQVATQLPGSANEDGSEK
jgi:hypothetical protein